MVKNVDQCCFFCLKFVKQTRKEVYKNYIQKKPYKKGNRKTYFYKICLVYFVLLLLNACSYYRPKSIRGVIDLTGVNLEFQLVPLDGEWNLYRNQLLTPDDVKKDKLPINPVESLTGNNFYSQYSYATYYLKILNLPINQIYGLKIDQFLHIKKLWINGNQKINTDDDNKKQYLSILDKKKLIFYFYPDQSQTELIIQVVQLKSISNIMKNNIMLGQPEVIQRSQNINIGLDLFIFGILMVATLYNLGTFLFNKTNYAVLYLGIICLLLSVRTLFISEKFITAIFPHLDCLFLLKSEYLTLYSTIPFVLLCYKTLYLQRNLNLFIVISISSIILADILIILIPVQFFHSLLIPFQIMIIIIFIYIIYNLVKMIIQGTKDAPLFLLIFLLLLISVINKLMFTMDIIHNLLISQLVIILFIISITILLTRKQSHALFLIEAQTQELLKTNEAFKNEIIERKKIENSIRECQKSLEKTVEERTNELMKLNLNLREQIEDRKKDEIKIREREMNLAVTLDSIGDGVIVTDHLGFITRINPVAEKLTGYKNSEALGCYFDEIFSTIDTNTRKKLKSPINKLLNGITANIHKSSLSLIAKNGIEYYISVIGNPIIDKDENTIGFIIVFKDITEEIKLQEQLNQAKKMETLGKLAGGISHDFNNLLSGIIGNAEMLNYEIKNNQQTEIYGEYIDTILHTSQRAKDFISQLMAFSRRGKIQTVSVDIHNIIFEIINILKYTIDPRIKLHYEFNALSSIITGDPSQIQNALLNIAINAKDALPQGGQITFKTNEILFKKSYCEKIENKIKPGKYLEIAISDNGIGIPKHILDHIFEPFFTTKAVNKGIGLGLSATYGIINNHKGMITVESKVNRGTIFKINLPLADIKIEYSNQNNENKIYNGEGMILLVDDELLIRNMVNKMLNFLGYTAVLAEDGQEAIEKFTQYNSSIDLVILDMIMPRMNGREALKEMMQINPAIKVLIASGYSMNEEIQAAIKEGACSFIQKPFTLSDLSKKIAEILTLKKTEMVTAQFDKLEQ